MRLWNALHTLVREKLAGRGRAGKKGVRPRSHLEVEGLDQRLLPSSFQWGMHQQLPSLQWGVGQGITAPVQDIHFTQTPSYDLATHEKGAPVAGPIEVLSFNFGAANGGGTTAAAPMFSLDKCLVS
jgi:hypothetical protein